MFLWLALTKVKQKSRQLCGVVPIKLIFTGLKDTKTRYNRNKNLYTWHCGIREKANFLFFYLCMSFAAYRFFFTCFRMRRDNEFGLEFSFLLHRHSYCVSIVFTTVQCHTKFTLFTLSLSTFQSVSIDVSYTWACFTIHYCFRQIFVLTSGNCSVCGNQRRGSLIFDWH